MEEASFESHMASTRSRWLILSMLTGFLAVGIPYWFVPYNKVSLPDTLLGPGLFVVAVSTLLLCMCGAASFWRATFMMAASVGAAIVARVLVGTAIDPTSHNLWPLEVIIAFMVGFVCALGGALVGSLIARWLPNLPGKGRP